LERWHAFKADEQVPQWAKNQAFKRFIEDHLPQTLIGILDEVVTPESLMEAQHRVVTRLGALGGDDQGSYERIARNLSLYKTATLDLQQAGFTVVDFFRLQPGFNPGEMKKIDDGAMTIKDVMNHRPGVIMRPLIAHTKQ